MYVVCVLCVSFLGTHLSSAVYSDREKNRKSCRIVTMSGNETTVVNPVDNQAKKFKFDHSYWSHDGYVVCDNGYYAAQDGSHYVDQVCTVLHVLMCRNRTCLHCMLHCINCSCVMVQYLNSCIKYCEITVFVFPLRFAPLSNMKPQINTANKHLLKMLFSV